MRRAAFLGTLILAMGLAACGEDEAAAPMEIRPARLFTGFDDGSATYKVPATLVGAGKTVKWTVGDGNLATVETEMGNQAHVIVTTKKAGKTTLKATANGKVYEVPLTITQYPAGARDVGNDLYQEDRSTAGGDPGMAGTKALGCIGCHGARGSARHSPSEIGGFDDPTILKAIATAERPGGKGLANNGNHKYPLDDKEKEAIMARLRSLEPVEFPE